MSLTAIYVYAPATFQIDGTVECFDTSTFESQDLSPDTPVKLSAGVYRMASTSTVTALDGADCEIVQVDLVEIDGTKKPFPDPPLRAEELGFGKEEAEVFFGGLPERIEL